MKEKLLQIFQKVGLMPKIEAKTELNAEEWQNVRASYKEAFGSELDDDVTLASTAIVEEQAQFNANVMAILSTAVGHENPQPTVPSQSTTKEATASILSSITQIVTNYNALMKQPVQDETPTIGGDSRLSMEHTDLYVFGIESPLFTTDKRWNKITVNPSIAQAQPLSAQSAKKTSEAFFSELSEYAASFAGRVSAVTQNPSLLSSTPSLVTNDKSSYFSQFVTRRQDAIISHIAKFKNIYEFFPRRFNVQDRELMTNAFFGSYSQGYQEGRVFKGSIELRPEWCYVDDAMLKTLFSSYKELERLYLGYLNTEGSSPIKWSFIEWALVRIAESLMLEQAKRKIWGCYTAPEKDKPGHFYNAGNGLLTTIMRYYHENKVLPFFSDYTLNSAPDGAAMFKLIDEMYNKVSSIVDDVNDFEIILNENHRKLYLDYITDAYGKNTDYVKDDTRFYNTSVKIRWAPYMFNLPLILFQKRGNLQAIENVPGEMLATSFDVDMESVAFWSVWKEGFAACYAGKGFSSREDLVEDDMQSQEIFFNIPGVATTVDATTITAKKDRFFYSFGENTASKAITDIEGAKKGLFYVLEHTGKTNPQTIAKTGKFSEITAAFAPTKTGDYIIVTLNSDGDKFRELERCENGIRTINGAVLPNLKR